MIESQQPPVARPHFRSVAQAATLDLLLLYRSKDREGESDAAIEPAPSWPGVRETGSKLLGA
jgi:hypothetical protein